MYQQDINFRISCFSLNDTFAFIEQRNQPVEQLIFMWWGVIIPIISVVGYSGNCLTMIVLFRREIQLTTIFFLRTLVVTDTAIILGGVLNLSVIAITLRDKNQWLFNDVIYPHLVTPLNYIVSSLQMINVWVTVAMAMERYITTSHPLRSMDICTKKNAFISIAVAVVMSVLYNIPRCFALTTARCYDAKYNIFFSFFVSCDRHGFWKYVVLYTNLPLLDIHYLNIYNTIVRAFSYNYTAYQAANTHAQKTDSILYSTKQWIQHGSCDSSTSSKVYTLPYSGPLCTFHILGNQRLDTMVHCQ